jgi:CheY-like chemotaxis protein
MTNRCRILVVEDEVLVRDFIVEVLEEHGCEVTGAVGSGEEAIESAAAAPPDFALVDIKLGGQLDGIELARRLAEQGIGCLFASGSNDAPTRARATEVGSRGFLGKPFRAAQLTEAIDALCRPSG